MDHGELLICRTRSVLTRSIVDYTSRRQKHIGFVVILAKRKTKMAYNVPQQPVQPNYSIVQQVQDLTQNPLDLWKEQQKQEAERLNEQRNRALAADMLNQANQTGQRR